MLICNIDSACRVLKKQWPEALSMGRLISRFLSVFRVVMDSSHLLVAFSSFVVGYWSRSSAGSVEKVVDNRPCHCVCSVSAPPTGENDSFGPSFSFWIISLILAVLAVVLIGNVALVCKVSWKDNIVGTDREVQLGFKGKSKGVYNASRGIAITG